MDPMGVVLVVGKKKHWVSHPNFPRGLAELLPRDATSDGLGCGFVGDW